MTIPAGYKYVLVKQTGLVDGMTLIYNVATDKFDPVAPGDVEAILPDPVFDTLHTIESGILASPMAGHASLVGEVTQAYRFLNNDRYKTEVQFMLEFTADTVFPEDTNLNLLQLPDNYRPSGVFSQQVTGTLFMDGFDSLGPDQVFHCSVNSGTDITDGYLSLSRYGLPETIPDGAVLAVTGIFENNYGEGA